MTESSIITHLPDCNAIWRRHVNYFFHTKWQYTCLNKQTGRPLAINTITAMMMRTMGKDPFRPWWRYTLIPKYPIFGHCVFICLVMAPALQCSGCTLWSRVPRLVPVLFNSGTLTNECLQLPRPGIVSIVDIFAQAWYCAHCSFLKFRHHKYKCC